MFESLLVRRRLALFITILMDLWLVTLLFFCFLFVCVLFITSLNLLSAFLWRWSVFKVCFEGFWPPTPIFCVQWLYQTPIFNNWNACTIDKGRIHSRDWSTLNQIFRHVCWLVDRFVNWFWNGSCWDYLNWRMPDLLHQPSRTFKWNSYLRHIWNQSKLVLIVDRVVWSYIFVNFPDDLNLIDNQLWWVSDDKVFSGENILSVVLKPGEDKVFADSVLSIDFDQAA